MIFFLWEEKAVIFKEVENDLFTCNPNDSNSKSLAKLLFYVYFTEFQVR